MRRIAGVWSVVAAGAVTVAILPVGLPVGHPVGLSVAHAEEWQTLDLHTADHVNVVLGADGLRAGPHEPMGAALREEARETSALVVFSATELETTASTIELDVDSSSTSQAPDLTAEVRGRTDTGWSEWRVAEDAAAGLSTVRLAAPAHEVQVRVGLGPESARDDERINAVRVRTVAEQNRESGEVEPLEESPFSARVFATRIGLVGDQTANGHIIEPDDYFAALPSRRGLAQRGEGDYTVRVCTVEQQRRCAYLPVWDVGPWNIKDDHWNEPREVWTDLPHGRPQAEAAYQDGHNDGVDGFGRRVANPAGIDLADGAFQIGLELPTNAWVDVDYLWTGGDDAPARVATASESDPVVLRAGPDTSYPDVGRAAHSAQVRLECRASGREVSGPRGESSTWYRLGAGDFIPATFVEAADDPDDQLASCGG